MSSTPFHKIDRDSVNAITNALSFFEIPATNTSISSSSVNELLTLNPVTIQPLHFTIHSSNNYLDLSRLYVLTELRIRKSVAGAALTNLVAEDNVSVCQLIGHTIWKNARLSINGVQIYDANSLQAYKSIFDHELSYPETVKRSYLSVAGYYKDGETSQTDGTGFNDRKALFALSRTAQFLAKLDLDLCNQPRYIVNQVELNVELLPNSSAFLVIAPNAPANTRYQLEIQSCRLYVKRIDLMDSLAYDISKRLELKPARYPVRKTAMKSIFISEHRTEYSGPLFLETVPRRLVLAMLSNADFTGSQTTSPFNFKPFGLRSVSIMASGVQIPQAPYNFDFAQGQYVRAFHDMYEAVGMAGSVESNGISMKSYAQGGQCFFVFNLTPSSEDSAETFELLQSGATIVQLKFSERIPDGGVALLCLAEFDSLLMIDRNRNVAHDAQSA